jgi:hypothetical protein
VKTQGRTKASSTYVYSLTGRTRLITMAPVLVYIPGTACRLLVDFFRPGELRIPPGWLVDFLGRYSRYSLMDEYRSSHSLKAEQSQDLNPPITLHNTGPEF